MIIPAPRRFAGAGQALVLQLLGVLGLVSPGLIGAERVALEVSGKRFNGELVRMTQTEVVLRMAEGEQAIPIAFLKPPEIYACRRLLPEFRTAKGHLELGHYCLEQGLKAQAEEEFKEAFQLDPSLKGSVARAKAEDIAIVAARPAAVQSGKVDGSGPANPEAAPGASAVPAGGAGSASRIDGFISAKLAAAGLVASGRSTDEEFLRRVYLDVVGLLPSSLAVKKFLADRSSGKRAKLIDELLASEHYARHWAVLWGDLLRERSRPNGDEGAVPGSYRDWLYNALGSNLRYDKFASALIDSTGTSADNGAVNFYLRDGNERTETVNTVASVFMGTRMACAQCHDHPFDNWEQQDFHSLMAFFSPRTAVSIDLGQTVARVLKDEKLDGAVKAAFSTALGEVEKPAPAKGAPGKGREQPGRRDQGSLLKQLEQRLSKEQAELARRAFYGNRVSRVEERSQGEYQAALDAAKPGQKTAIPAQFPWDKAQKAGGEPSRRAALARMVTGSRRFAEVQVNRLWAQLLGRGLVEPVDDFRAKNQPSHPEVLAYLADELVQSGFDAKHVLRLILNSETYQRSTNPTKANAADRTLYSHQRLRRMTAEQLYDAILLVTGRKQGVPVSGTEGLNIKTPPPPEEEEKFAFLLQTPAPFGSFLQSFHQPLREQMIFRRDHSASITQALELFNGRSINEAVSSRKGLFVKWLCATYGQNAQAIVTELYLASLSRYPSNWELSRALRHLASTAQARGVEDLQWALLNTREFMFIR